MDCSFYGLTSGSKWPEFDLGSYYPGELPGVCRTRKFTGREDLMLQEWALYQHQPNVMLGPRGSSLQRPLPARCHPMPVPLARLCNGRFSVCGGKEQSRVQSHRKPPLGRLMVALCYPVWPLPVRGVQCCSPDHWDPLGTEGLSSPRCAGIK